MSDDNLIRATFPGPAVGPEASAGTLHPTLGLLQPGTCEFGPHQAELVQAALDAGLLAAIAPAPTPPPAAAAPRTQIQNQTQTLPKAAPAAADKGE